MDKAAQRVLKELTGLENVYMEQVGTYGEIHRDPGERVISVAYSALININEYDRELVDRHNASWTDLDKIPPLVFDHQQMVEQALAWFRRNPHTTPKPLRSHLRQTHGQTEFPQTDCHDGLY